MYTWHRVGKGRKLHAFYIRRHDNVSNIAPCGVGPRGDYADLPRCTTCDRAVWHDEAVVTVSRRAPPGKEKVGGMGHVR